MAVALYIAYALAATGSIVSIVLFSLASQGQLDFNIILILVFKVPYHSSVNIILPNHVCNVWSNSPTILGLILALLLYDICASNKMHLFSVITSFLS